MSTFSSHGATAMMMAVAQHLDIISRIDEMDVHTVALVLDGRHGEFNLVVDATDMDTMEEHRWTGIAHRGGGVTDFEEVDFR